MKTKILYLLIILLTIVSTFSPTSEGGIIIPRYTVIVGILCFSILIIIFSILNKGRINKKLLISGSVAMLSLLLSTLTSPSSELALGSAIFYVSFILITIIDFSKINSIAYTKIVDVLNIPILFSSFFILTDNSTFKLLLINNYSAYYEELVRHMLSINKPVTFFASHSISGFVYFILFYINFEIFKASQKRISFIVSIIYLFLLFKLKSVTSLTLLLISIIYILYNMLRTIKGYLILVSILTISIIFKYNFLIEQIELIYDTISTSYLSSINGFSGRYSSSSGVLSQNIFYLKNNFFRPLGFTVMSQIHFVDSGIIEYLLRGGIALMVSMYYSFYQFLKINISNKKHVLFLFFSFIAFETGFASLVTPRIVFIIPLMVVSLNSISNLKLQNKPNAALLK